MVEILVSLNSSESEHSEQKWEKKISHRIHERKKT